MHLAFGLILMDIGGFFFFFVTINLIITICERNILILNVFAENIKK